MRYPLKLSEVEFQAFKASGPGGQHRNKTSSAIRAIHIPTNTRVEAVNERCQHKNKEMAIQMLQAKLDRRLEERAAAQRQDAYHAKPDASFSAQIRTYRLAGKHQGVEDHRTGHYHPNAANVLRGNLDGFIRAGLVR